MSFGIRNASNDNFNNLYYYITSTMFTIGDYKYSATTTDANGWLFCNGRSLLISDYPELYDVIGDAFGAGEGEFNLPDYRGSVLGAVGQSDASDATNHPLGQFTGTEKHTLTIPEMPTHNHTGTTNSAGNHTHGVTDPGHSHTYLGIQSQNVGGIGTDAAENSPRPTETSGTSFTEISINQAGAHTHTFTTDNTGGSLPHNNMQPTLFGGNVFILAKFYKTFNNDKLRGIVNVM